MWRPTTRTFEAAQRQLAGEIANVFFDIKHETIENRQIYTDLEACIKANTDGTHHGHRLHVNTEMQRAEQAVSDRLVKGAIGIFGIQYPAIEMAKKGAGQSPLDFKVSAKVREALLQGAADAQAVLEAWKGLPIGKMFSGVAIWGTTAKGLPTKGLERQGLASCRLQEAGPREIVFAPVFALMEYGVDAGIAREEKHTYTYFFSRNFSDPDDTESLEKFKAFGSLHRAALRAGQFLYVPMGWMIIERMLGGLNAYGFRTAAFDTTA